MRRTLHSNYIVHVHTLARQCSETTGNSNTRAKSGNTRAESGLIYRLRTQRMAVPRRSREQARQELGRGRLCSTPRPAGTELAGTRVSDSSPASTGRTPSNLQCSNELMTLAYTGAAIHRHALGLQTNVSLPSRNSPVDALAPLHSTSRPWAPERTRTPHPRLQPEPGNESA